jgi:hypothetical protein
MLQSISSIGKPTVDTLTAELKSTSIVDICSSDPRSRGFIMTLSIGTVLPSDSLLGFDFELLYDSTKFRFTFALSNTLYDLFENKLVNFGYPGKMTGYAVQFSNNVIYGNMPLAAFYGE